MPRLLLDENLSEAVLKGLTAPFEGSIHVRREERVDSSIHR